MVHFGPLNQCWYIKKHVDICPNLAILLPSISVCVHRMSPNVLKTHYHIGYNASINFVSLSMDML